MNRCAAPRQPSPSSGRPSRPIPCSRDDDAHSASFRSPDDCPHRTAPHRTAAESSCVPRNRVASRALLCSGLTRALYVLWRFIDVYMSCANRARMMRAQISWSSRERCVRYVLVQRTCEPASISQSVDPRGSLFSIYSHSLALSPTR